MATSNRAGDLLPAFRTHRATFVQTGKGVPAMLALAGAKAVPPVEIREPDRDCRAPFRGPARPLSALLRAAHRPSLCPGRPLAVGPHHPGPAAGRGDPGGSPQRPRGTPPAARLHLRAVRLLAVDPLIKP